MWETYSLQSKFWVGFVSFGLFSFTKHVLLFNAFVNKSVIQQSMEKEILKFIPSKSLTKCLARFEELFWAAWIAPGKETRWLFTAAAHFLDCDTGTPYSRSWAVAGEVVERTAVLTQHRCGSPTVTVTRCLQFPLCCRGTTVTWQGGADAFPSRWWLSWAEASESLQKAFSTFSCGRAAASCNRVDELLKRGVNVLPVTMFRGQRQPRS